MLSKYAADVLRRAIVEYERRTVRHADRGNERADKGDFEAQEKPNATDARKHSGGNGGCTDRT